MTDTPIPIIETEYMEQGTTTETPTYEHETKIKQNLKNFEETQKSIDEIKLQVDKIITSIALNQSFLTRAATYWGSMPLWQKITAGIALIVPTIALGIVFNIIALYVVSAFTLATYVATSFVLDNHNQYDEQITGKLQNSMTSLSVALGTVIGELNILREELADEVEILKQENERLSQKIELLREEVNTFTEKEKSLQETALTLRALQSELEKKQTFLQESIVTYTDLAERNKAELEKTTAAMAQNHEDLSSTILDLAKARDEMGKELEEVKSISEFFKNAVEKLSEKAIKDQADRQVFLETFRQAFNERDDTFKKITAGFSKVQQELSLTKSALVFCNQQFVELQERQEIELAKIEELTSLHPALQKGYTQTLRDIGFYAVDENTRPPLTEKKAVMQPVF